MIQLFLDGMPAIPKDNQSIKLTAENHFFTKSASYTYDVELPLAIDENRRIFGNIHRMDISKQQRIMEAVLNVDNVTVLSGTAHITSVSDASVKVQLLGEAASYNYGNKLGETFIDELDLGNWFMVTWPDGSHWVHPRGQQQGHWEYYPEDTEFKGTARPVFVRATFNYDGTWDYDNILYRVYDGTYPWVAFPVMNSNAEFLCNGFAFRFSDPGTGNARPLIPFFRGYVGERTTRNDKEAAVTSTAIQPFVWIIAELVAKATGFTLDRKDNALFTNHFFKRIFIVNANNMIECNKCLPHWSVNDFWTQLENTFGLVLSFDYANKRMWLKHRADHYRKFANIVCIDNVVDEYSVEVDDSTKTDISVNSVGFSDFDANPADLLDEYITENCDVNNDFNGIEDLLAWAKANESELPYYKGTLFNCKDGRQFIYSEEEGIIEVNQFRPRVPDGNLEKIDVQLKFVPARFIDGECEIYPYQIHNQGNIPYEDKPVGSFPVKMLQVPDISEMDWYKKAGYSDINIEALINEEDEAESSTADKEDCIFIAIMGDSKFDDLNVKLTFTDGTEVEDKNMFFPRPRIRERMKAALSDAHGAVEDAPYSLSLIPIDGQQNLAANTIADSVVIDAKIRQCIKFVADRIPDPSDIFLIHNRRFVCEKIEADIDSSGLKRMLTGYFYELTL